MAGLGLERVRGGSPSGVWPYSSGWFLIRRDNGKAASTMNRPSPAAVHRQPSLSASGSTNQLSMGIRTMPPRSWPSVAMAMALERCLANQLLMAEIIGSQEPSPKPKLMRMKTR